MGDRLGFTPTSSQGPSQSTNTPKPPTTSGSSPKWREVFAPKNTTTTNGIRAKTPARIGTTTMLFAPEDRVAEQSAQQQTEEGGDTTIIHHFHHHAHHRGEEKKVDETITV